MNFNRNIAIIFILESKLAKGQFDFDYLNENFTNQELAELHLQCCEYEYREEQPEPKVFSIESQIVDNLVAASYLILSLKTAKEAGYTIVHDHWAQGCYDIYSIDDAIERFETNNLVMHEVVIEGINGDLPF